ncbi:hypothetical protein [Hymenobacter swuensis]|uniref:Uncharacterized protein n=1 Tax=Hymenobacter swuensis DY53 TaxID=1227739 RepID=W8EQR3_9BACT|nr:hypothetical protein [Hymenobacter swuensis]AHJ95469.1 hypothetical protein Hsw_PA0136 [Hymenobacter swuensis DY53]
MKHFSICLLMLLLLVLGKHNAARLTLAAPLAQQRVAPVRPGQLPRVPLRRPGTGPGPRVAALVAR